MVIILPNYVKNIIEVYAKKDNDKLIDFLKQHIKDDIFDFNTIIPEPKTEEECPSRYNLNICSDMTHNKKTLYPPDSEEDWFNWYDWRSANWMTKWNSCGLQYFDYEKIVKNANALVPLTIVFDTAWTQPEPVILELFRLHPELNITWSYYSTDNGRSGSYFKLFKENEVIHSKYNLCGCGEDIIDINTGKLNKEVVYDD